MLSKSTKILISLSPGESPAYNTDVAFTYAEERPYDCMGT